MRTIYYVDNPLTTVESSLESKFEVALAVATGSTRDGIFFGRIAKESIINA